MAKIKPEQAKHLRQLLKENDITQAKLAERLGVSEVSVSRWINGKSRISMSNAEAIHDLYADYSVDYLLGYSEYPNAAVEAELKRIEESEKLDDERTIAMRLAESIEVLARLNGVTGLNPIIGNDEEHSDLGGNGWIYMWNAHKPKRDNFGLFLELCRNGQALFIKDSDWLAFQDEILGYVGFRLDQIFERGRW